MFGRRSKPKGWQGFSTIKDEEDAPFKGGPSVFSRILVLVLTFILAVALGALAGFVLYFASFSRMGRLLLNSSRQDFYGTITVCVIVSVGFWAWACFKEKQTRYVAEHYKDPRPTYKRPETERERVWRERQRAREVERELGGTGADAKTERNEDSRSL
jgi:hypothetical protein